MMCEKCKVKPATVHITQTVSDSTGQMPTAWASQHYCETCGREVIQSNPELKAASNPELKAPWVSGPVAKTELRFASPPAPPPPQPEIDTSKRYDVYCFEPNRGTVLYRNALLKVGGVLLPAPGGRTFYPDYVELEQENSQSVFISRQSIVRFCLPGTALVGELIPSKKPDAP